MCTAPFIINGRLPCEALVQVYGHAYGMHAAGHAILLPHPGY
jgi:hypothetical protein